VPVLKFIFKLSLSQNCFPNLWKQTAIFLVFIKRRPIGLLNNVYKVFEFLIYDHVSHFLKSKLNSSQHDFIKSKCAVTNLVTFLDFVTSLLCSEGQTDSYLF
jgi:hypothetical protein